MSEENVVRCANVGTWSKHVEAGFHACSIVGCLVVWKRGGRAGRDGALPLCPRHYHRLRRGSARADSADKLEARERVTYRPPGHVLELIRAEQKRRRKAKLPASISDALTALLERTTTEGRADP